MVFTASLLSALHSKGVVENKRASLLAVLLGKALNRTPPPLCGRHVAQFYLRTEGWWQKGHQTVKPKCQEVQITIVAIPNRESSPGEFVHKWK